MTTTITTQCPHCEAVFNLNKLQYHRANAKMMCNVCARVFLINDHILSLSEAAPSTYSTSSHQPARPNAQEMSQATSIPSSLPPAPSRPHSAPATSTSAGSLETEPTRDHLSTSIASVASTTSVAPPSTLPTAGDLSAAQALTTNDRAASTDSTSHTQEFSAKTPSSEDVFASWLQSAPAPITPQAPAPQAPAPQAVMATPSAAQTNAIHPDLANTTTSQSSQTASTSPSEVDSSSTDSSIPSLTEGLTKGLTEGATNDPSNGSTTDPTNSSSTDAHSPKDLTLMTPMTLTTEKDTDLSQLLIDMGVPYKEETEKVYSYKPNSQPLERTYVSDSQLGSRVATVLWSIGCLVLGLLLMAQYVIFNATTLITNPAHSKRLHQLCAIAACSLPSADLNQLAVADINHGASQIEDGTAFTDIQATLENHSTEAQLYPNLKVRLYGPDKLIGEFIAAPKDYLLSPQNQLSAQGKKQFWFTVPVADQDISTITVEPLY